MDSGELRRMLVLANEFKEGDLLVGGTGDQQLRQDARLALLATRLLDIHRTTLVEDGVSDALARSLDRYRDADTDRLTVGELKHKLLSPDAPRWVRRHRDALASEAIAAVVKVMTNDELSIVACAIFNPLPADRNRLRQGYGGPPKLHAKAEGPPYGGVVADRQGPPNDPGRGGITVGSPQHFGSRIQPNSPGDDEEEILFSILEGLAYGCGDVIVGLNPASDDLETIVRLEQLLQRVVTRLELPTRYCVLSDIVKQHRARERTQVDVGFQSLAGTSRALAGMVGLDVDEILDLARAFDALYFETGQGSAVTNGTAEGVDMVTLEARAYGVARYVSQQSRAWMIVNDVAGFIGPEVFRTVEQLERACLEDTVMAKLHGLTMGLDVCATFHMGISPAELHHVTERIVERAAPAYLMAVAGNADPMLGYLTTSFREHPRLRRRSGRHMTTAMRARLADLGLVFGDKDVSFLAAAAAQLYARYAKAGGDWRTSAALMEEGVARLNELQRRGYDLGYGCGQGHASPPAVDARLDAIYGHARRALYATLDRSVIADVSPRHVRVRTRAVDREDYLAHPASGEHLREADARVVAALYPVERPQVQLVISDGLNANALNEHVRALMPPLRRMLAEAGCLVGETDVVVENGRVRAGYHVGQLVNAAVIVHFIGERPGTGLNAASAYLTYGRDVTGCSRWGAELDHSCTTAVCSIHPLGKPPAVAAAEIARDVARILEQRCSGVALRVS
jgi:ethanolamine ammonia-lyase large subunit